MKKYLIRVNCIGFLDIEVEAKNLAEARNLAEKQFNCGSVEGEAEEEELNF